MAKAPAAAQAEPKSMLDMKYRYDTLRVPGKDGKIHYVRGNHDALTLALALHMIVNGKDIMAVAKANKLELGEYGNPGQLRMAIGNKLRAMVKRGEPVTIGAVTVESLDQAVELPVVEDAADEPAPKPVKAAAKPAKGKAAAANGRKPRRKAEAAA